MRSFRFGRLNRLVATVALSALLATPAAQADFYKALVDYQAGKFAEASTQFLELAELGDGPSQYNLGAMALRGEGMDKNQGVGVGWLLASAENGYKAFTPEKLAEFRAGLSAEHTAAANKIVAQYGIQALRERVLPGPVYMRTCRQFRPPQTEQMARPVYPISATTSGQDGIVIIGFTVGVDGLARDPRILAAAPLDIFEDVTINAILQSRFLPAMRNGEKVESTASMRMTYSMQDGGVLWNLRAIKQVKEQADKGNPGAKYIIGLLGSLDPTLGMTQDAARDMILSAAQAGQPQAGYWVAEQLAFERLCGNPDKAARWLQQASKGGDAAAQIELVRYQIESNSQSVNVSELKALLTAAAAKDNAYALKHVAALFANPPIEQLADKELALSTAQRLKKYDDSLDPHINEVMAAAFAANAKFRDAIKQQERAIKKARSLYWNTADMELRLAAFRENRAASGDVLKVPPSSNPPPVKNEIAPCDTKKGCGRKHGDEGRAPLKQST